MAASPALAPVVPPAGGSSPAFARRGRKRRAGLGVRPGCRPATPGANAPTMPVDDRQRKRCPRASAASLVQACLRDVRRVDTPVARCQPTAFARRGRDSTMPVVDRQRGLSPPRSTSPSRGCTAASAAITPIGDRGRESSRAWWPPRSSRAWTFHFCRIGVLTEHGRVLRDPCQVSIAGRAFTSPRLNQLQTTEEYSFSDLCEPALTTLAGLKPLFGHNRSGE